MKRWAQFILCLVLSFSIWLIHNLSQSYAEIVSVPVIAYSNIEGRSQNAADVVTIVARCKASGSRILSFRRTNRPVKVYFKPEDFVHVGADVYEVGESALNRYTREIFGDEVAVEGFVSHSYKFIFAEESCKKVPVHAVSSISFKPQYMAADKIKVEPDSIMVYAEPSRLENIDAVFTRTIGRNDLSKSVRGVVKLEKIPGVRMSENECVYSLDVVRFVEITADVAISARNVPAGSDFSYYPSKCKATFRCMFPLGSTPSDKVEFYVDYREFANSLTGKCVVHSTELNGNIIDCTIEPEVCDCLERGFDQ